MLHQAIELIMLAVRAFLAVMLIVAGVAKLTDRTGFALTLVRLGVSTRRGQLERTIALFVPLIELSLGLLLITGLWPITMDALVLILMIGFTGVIAFALRKAPGATCRCFGALNSAHFSPKLLLRNIGLSVAALFVLLANVSVSFESAPPWLVVALVTQYLMLAVVATQAVRVLKELAERMAV
jgi:uncharacterized membrane protein YphA (DoxX/SURF4 family)